MRSIPLKANLTRVYNTVAGLYCAMKLEVSLGRNAPGSVRNLLVDAPVQWRVYWSGPTSPQAPILRVCWGFPLAEYPWIAARQYRKVRRRNLPERAQVRLNLGSGQLRKSCGFDYLPTGPWSAQLTCDPDENVPLRAVLVCSPRLYLPQEAPKPQIKIPESDVLRLTLP